jgi:hypothetical protein
VPGAESCKPGTLPASFNMTLPATYISLHLLTVVVLFLRIDGAGKFKKSLITAHLILLLLLLVDIFIINFRGVWLDRILVVVFLLTASLTFALYRRTLLSWQKVYFGFFLFYPIAAAVIFIIDRIMFVIVAGPLLVTLTVPETKLSTGKYELREIVGAMVPVQIALVEKGLITEKYLGVSNNEKITYNNITGLEIVRKAGDATFVLVKSGGKYYEISFHK